jgi:hypothetical protein
MGIKVDVYGVRETLAELRKERVLRLWGVRSLMSR